MIELVSYCGKCKEQVTPKAYQALMAGETVTLPCGHENEFSDLFTPLAPRAKAMRETPAVKRAHWYVLSTSETLAVGEDAGDELLACRTLEGAWDTYHSGRLEAETAADDQEWRDAKLFLHELKVHRFMDFYGRFLQDPAYPFDTREFEGAKFISKNEDPGSCGVVVKRSYLRSLKVTEVTIEDAPAESIYFV